MKRMDHNVPTNDIRSVLGTLSPSQIEELVYLCNLGDQKPGAAVQSPVNAELLGKCSPVSSASFVPSSSESLDVDLPFPDFLRGYPTSDSGGEFDHYSPSGSERDGSCFDIRSLMMNSDPCLNVKLENSSEMSSLGYDFNPSLFDAGLANLYATSATTNFDVCSSGSINFSSSASIVNDFDATSGVGSHINLEAKTAHSSINSLGVNVPNTTNQENLNLSNADIKQITMLLKMVLDRAKSEVPAPVSVRDDDFCEMDELSPTETVVCAAPSLPNASQLKSLLVNSGKKFAYGINMAVNTMHKIPLKPKKLKFKKGGNSLPETILPGSAVNMTSSTYYPGLLLQTDAELNGAKNQTKVSPKSIPGFPDHFGISKVVPSQVPVDHSTASAQPVSSRMPVSDIQLKSIPQVTTPLLLPMPNTAPAHVSRGVSTTSFAAQGAPSLAASKIPIQPLKSSKLPPTVDLDDDKKPRKKRISNHNLIEKRYRNNITSSLEELKDLMLGVGHKATKNNILRHAIDQIKELTKKNRVLEEENNQIRRFFERLKGAGVIHKDVELPVARPVSPVASRERSAFPSETSEESMSPDSDMYDNENDNDNSVSPRSPMFLDRTRILTCLMVFMCLFLSPFAMLGGQASPVHSDAHQSRVLLSVPNPAETTFTKFITSTLIHMLVSMLIIMWMLFKGKPRCLPESKQACQFWTRMNLAKASMNEGNYKRAKVDIQLAMINVGHKSALSCLDMLLSVIWNSICHILYQLGILPLLKTLAQSVLPCSVSVRESRSSEQFAAKLLSYGYESMHEVTLRDPSCSFLESSYCILNAINNAEHAGSHELLCKIYVVGAIHIKERLPLYLSHLLSCYFTNCAHHVAEAHGRDVPLSVEWIFEPFGYEFFTGGSWKLVSGSAFSGTSCGDLTQIVYEQYQSYLLLKSLKRIVIPDTSYPSEDPKERRNRTLNLLKQLATEADRDMLDDFSSYQQAFYGWWSSLLRQYITVKRTGEVNMQELDREKEFFEEFADDHHAASYTSDQVSAKQVLSLAHDQIVDASKRLAILTNAAETDEHEDARELIKILVCEMLLEASISLWELYGAESHLGERTLHDFQCNIAILKLYAAKYSELKYKVERYEMTSQIMSGSNPVSMAVLLKRKRKNYFSKGFPSSYQEAEENSECVSVGQKHLSVLERLWNADRYRQIQNRLSGRRS